MSLLQDTDFVSGTTVLTEVYMDGINDFCNGVKSVLGETFTAVAFRGALGYATGSTTITNIVPSTQYEATVSHGLGTDDIDFGFSFVNATSGQEINTDVSIRSYSRGQINSWCGQYAGTWSAITAPSAGNLTVAIKAASGATITVYWWARKRS